MLRHSVARLLPLSALTCLTAQSQFTAEIVAPYSLLPLTSVILADVDGDGDGDAFGVGPFGPHVLLRNDGRARFTDVTATLPSASGQPSLGVAAIDIEGDGDLDLFAGLFGTSPYASRLLRNNGNGVFADASANLPAGSNSPTAAVARDFDGDGDVDLAFVSHWLAGGQNTMLVNDGAGVFTAAYPFPVYLGFSIATADVDGDLDFDLVIGTDTGPRLLRNDGNLVFTDVTATALPALPVGNTLAVAFGDVDGDDDPDLVVARGADHVLRNTGGTFNLAATLTSAGAQSLALVDVDDDGDLDLLRAPTSGVVALGLNDGTGAFVDAPSRLPAGGVTVASARLAAGDLDGDGDGDALLASTIVGGQFTSPVVLQNRHRHVRAGSAVLGQPWTIDVFSAPGYATLDHQSRLGVGLGLLPQPVTVPGFGDLRLDLGAGFVLLEAVVPASAGHFAYSVALPPAPGLAGLSLHVQALLEQSPGPARFTGFDSVVLQ